MNVVYIKHFDNGKKYIGITKHFEKRMKEHERAKDNLPVHMAMKTHSHYTEIVFESEVYKDIIEMEKIIIQNYIDLGYELGKELYNLTLGGEGTLGCINHADVNGKNNPMYGKTHTDIVKEKLRQCHLGKSVPENIRKKISASISGANNPMYHKHHTEETKLKIRLAYNKSTLSNETIIRRKEGYKKSAEKRRHPIEYYTINPVVRKDFKRICKNQGFNFEEFNEIFSGERDSTKHKKFYYVYVGKNYKKEINYTHELHKPLEYYETHSTQRSNFINICKNNNWDVNDFNQILDKTLLTSTGRKYNLYFYVQNKIKKS